MIGMKRISTHDTALGLISNPMYEYFANLSWLPSLHPYSMIDFYSSLRNKIVEHFRLELSEFIIGTVSEFPPDSYLFLQ